MLMPTQNESNFNKLIVRHPLNFDSKIGRRESEANNFCRKRELVATGNQVMVGIATK